MLNAKEVTDKLREQQRRNNARDARWSSLRSARMGDLTEIAPEMFSEDFPKPIVANFIDTVARDMAEMIAPLPAFQCASATMQSDAARKFADTRTKIVQNYIAKSKLERQMLEGADHFGTYACAVFYLEPDFDEKLPRICMEDPIGGYADIDRWGRLRAYWKRYYAEAHELAVLYPEYYEQIEVAAKNTAYQGGTHCEIIRYCDADQIALVLLSKEPQMLVSIRNPLGEPPVVLARRPWLHREEYKGQFDDAVWIQIARDCLARLNLESVEKSVQAPLAMPTDVQEFAMGPDAIIRTATPEKVKRVGLDLPQGAFAESQVLMQELRIGTRYPEARSGNSDASIITGKGVSALLGGFDSQVKAAQLAFKDAFGDVVRLCFLMDEKYWPNSSKQITGQANGTPYSTTYTPSKHIKGDHTCDIEYGFASGMDPNRATVMLLQLRAEKVFSRDYLTRQLPFGINVHEEQSKVDVEDMREYIKQGIAGYVQSIPALAQQGMDPSGPVLKAAMIVRGIQKGDSIEDVVMAAFAPTPPPQAPPPPEAPGGAPGAPPGGPMGPGGPGGDGGLNPSGLMQGVAPGQAGMAPGGRPDLTTMLAGLTGGGKAQMSASVSRKRSY